MKRAILLLSLLWVFSCAAPQKEAAPPEAKPESKLPVKVQEESSLEIFKGLLDLTYEAERDEILPHLEVAYAKIIDEYPDASLAQESYWRLISLNLKDYEPPRVEKAESLYRQFTQRYPDSPIKYAVDDTLLRFYYATDTWERIIRISTPYVKEYIDTGNLKYPYFLFLYSEAKFNIGDLKEAEKGYRIIQQNVPDGQEAKISALRVKEIHKKMQKGQ